MNPTNIQAAMVILEGLISAAQKISQVVNNAHSEGRNDITEEELAVIIEHRHEATRKAMATS